VRPMAGWRIRRWGTRDVGCKCKLMRRRDPENGGNWTRKNGERKERCANIKQTRNRNGRKEGKKSEKEI
jgi:hypothetical protein